jgi:outer membrane lipoprotein-sorting protein
MDDDQWLYLPALRKVRRISASDRGDYFLGTDFTYEDIKLEGKLQNADYDFTLLGQEKINGAQVYRMEGVTKSKEIARELGYSRTEFWVDAEQWIILKANYWDPKGRSLKTLTVEDVRVIDGILTRHKLAVDNHKTGHRSEFTFSDVDYQKAVKDSLFSQRAMKRGK